MAIDWNKQVCLLTGASGGIGAAIAHEIAQRGGSLILAGRNAQKLAALAESLPGQHALVQADINLEADRDKVFKLCQERGITMLINNAGVTSVSEFHSDSIESMQAVVATNLLAPMALTHRLLPLLKRAIKAYVVNIGSAFGSIGFPCHSAYSASKFGLRGWTESLIREYHESNVNFFYLAPRATATAINAAHVVDMNKALGNQMDPPEKVAQALIKQLNGGHKRVFVGSPEKWFARINGVLPGLVDNALAKKLKTIRHFVTSGKQEKAI